MNFLYACNDHYAPYAGISIYSLLENNRHEDVITVYVLANNVSELNKSKFRALSDKFEREINLIDAAEIEKFLVDEMVHEFDTGGRETYYRLFADRILPDYIRKIIYLDCDTIVTGDLHGLYNTDIESNQVCAMVCASYMKYYKEYIGVNDNEPLFQAGVALIDLDKWKQNRVGERIIELFNHGINYLRIHDQDILNLILKGHIRTLPLRYNVFPNWNIDDIEMIINKAKKDGVWPYGFEEVKDAIANVKVLHYCGEKPWTKGNRVSQKEVWEKYKNESPWCDIPYAEFKLGFLKRCETYLRRLLPRDIYNAFVEYIHKRIVRRYYARHDHFAKRARYNEAIRDLELAER